MECFTCKITEAVDKSYPIRDAVFGKTSGRCMWHAWDDDKVFVCDQCGKSTFSEQVAWCRKTDKFICTACAPSRTVKDTFWFWKEYHVVTCPFCGEDHPTLNRQEFDGEHPWQADPFRCKQFPIWYPDGRLIREREIKKPEEKEAKKTQKAVRCPSCGNRISVTKPGTYQCPRCGQRFTVRARRA
jgi:predicted RNA-binding Zn-ribbon protein involved in translation (DUF1610 family)